MSGSMVFSCWLGLNHSSPGQAAGQQWYSVPSSSPSPPKIEKELARVTVSVLHLPASASLLSPFRSFSPAPSPTSSPGRCPPLSPCRRLQNGTRLFPSQPAAVTQRRQPAAGARSEPTLSFRMTHWNLALISLFLIVDGEQPKSYTGLDQGKIFKCLFYPTATQRFEGAKPCTKAGTGTNWVGV